MLSPSPMIRDMDIMVDGAGRMTLLVPGKISPGVLTLVLSPGRVALAAEGVDFVTVDHVEQAVLDAIAGQAGGVGLIEILDPEKPPVAETHRAAIVDQRPKKTEK